MHERLFARLGQEAFLRGDPVTAIIARGVAVVGEYGQVVGHRTFATVPHAAEPKVGDTLAIGSETFTVDALQEDDGYIASVVLR